MIQKILLIISRIIVGLVFVFSGFVKAIDPWGTTYKIQDYLEAMGEWATQFSDFAFFVSVCLAALELTVGLGLLFNFKVKANGILAALMMVFMTPLTLWIALKNPVSDCGCFGDALVISNWATFWKNIVLSVLIAVIVVVAFKTGHKSKFSAPCQWIIECFSFFFSVAMSAYCYHSLPIVDFRPYKIGTDIEASMDIPDDAEPDAYETKLIYSKNGVQKEFTMDNYPKDDSTWVFVDQISTLVKKGYVPPIHDFTMDTEDGDITDDVLDNEGYTFLIVSYDLSLANMSEMTRQKLTLLSAYAQTNEYDIYLMTASTDDVIADFREQVNRNIPIVLTDKITLKTIVRYNPGVVLIKNGVILNKWSMPNLPVFNKKLDNSKLGIKADPKTENKVVVAFLIWLLPVLLLMVMDRRLNRGRD